MLLSLAGSRRLVVIGIPFYEDFTWSELASFSKGCWTWKLNGNLKEFKWSNLIPA